MMPRRCGDDRTAVRRVALGFAILLGATTSVIAHAGEVVLAQVISREHPSFDVAKSRLVAGRDGAVYLASGEHVARMMPDGTGRSGGVVTRAMWNAAANTSGLVATANAHFEHSVNLWSGAFVHRGKVDQFLSSDPTEWFGPCDVQAGKSDFYGMDQNRDRVVRISPDAKIVTTYSLSSCGESFVRKVVRFRVWEDGRLLYVSAPGGTVHAIGFDGRKRWSVDAGTGGNPWDGYRAAFDVDGDGRLHVLPSDGDRVRIFTSDGREVDGYSLEMGARRGGARHLALLGRHVLVKRRHPRELFEVYERAGGRLVRVVEAGVETLRVRYPSRVWLGGRATKFAIEFDAGARASSQAWRVEIAPWNVPRWTTLAHDDGTVTPPAGAGGIHRLRVSCGEYLVHDLVEIRAPDARGSVAVLTPQCRLYYGWGEQIPFEVLLSGEGRADVKRVPVRLTRDGAALARDTVTLDANGRGRARLAEALVRSLRPGPYTLEPRLDGYTCVPQRIVIGRGIEQRPVFSIVEHGDYSRRFPNGTPWDAPEKVADHIARSLTLGTNLYVDRLGHDGAGNMRFLFWNNESGKPLLDSLARRLDADRESVPTETVRVQPPLIQAIDAYGAHGIEQQAVLLNMDAGLPLGTGHDKRPPEKMADDVEKATKALAPHRAFRGWSWAANWWIHPRGAGAAGNPEDKAAYESALRSANETGAWSEVLDRVSDVWVSHAGDAERRFDAVLQRAAPGRLSVMTGPYRQVGILPPVAFSSADEVDLHYQAEQIQPPQTTPHNVDFYKRPGKRAWGHPEIWNDDGTGGMMLPALLQMVMRGADGVGWSGNVPSGDKSASDPRGSAPGATSVVRALTAILREYGPWLTTLRPRDRVAIVVSQRMMRIDEWRSIGGRYFDRLFEAYNACLYAHRPARFVFSEDLVPGALEKYGAVVLVGQTVDLEPALERALSEARRAGVPVFADGTCRARLVGEYRRLGPTFDRVERDPSAWQDDAAYYRFPRYFTDHAAQLEATLGAVVKPVAACGNPAIMLTERSSGDARFVWAVNNTPLGLDPGVAWRVCLIMSQRLPVVERLRLNVPAGGAVYDVFAHERVRPAAGKVTADLRCAPARLYAILPEPIGSVRLRAPRRVRPGQPFAWDLSILGRRRRELRASLPARVRLLDARGRVLDVRHLAVGDAARPLRPMAVPLDADGGNVTLEATELVSGLSATMAIAVGTAPAAVSFDAAGLADRSPARASAAAAGRAASTSLVAPATRFGPHFKDIAVSRDERSALVNAMNWDRNAYAVDLADGRIRWRSRLGHHFAYGPVAAGRDFVVQGYDLATAEGYHLYLLDGNGSARRRFALCGLPKRATNWASGGHLLDRIANFAASPDGRWFASAGDLGLAVWDRRGSKLWSLDWWAAERKRVYLAPIGSTAVLALGETTATAHAARTGRKLWRLRPAASGRLLGAVTTGNGRTVAMRADTEGGRIYIVREGKLSNTLFASADAMDLSPSGDRLAVTDGRELEWYDTAAGLVWSHTGDDTLRSPRVSPDGRRIAVSSELGTLTVLSDAGEVLHRRDLGALPVSRWLRGGDLLVATWMGEILRLDPRYEERWRTRAAPDEVDVRATLLASDATPTSRIDSWGNAEPAAAPLEPNLLTDTKAIVTAWCDPTTHGDPRTWQNPIASLTDGKPDAPPHPWLGWTEVNYIDSGWRHKLTIVVDTLRTQLRVTGVTFVEDADHPESWLRDVRLQYWDPAGEAWRDGPLMLSNTPVHTHRFETPLEAARFRLVTTGGGTWPAGNLRLGELVFHGETIGSSHPDVVAKRPVAVLFDEGDPIFERSFIHGHNPGLAVSADGPGAFSGGHYLRLGKGRGYSPGYEARAGGHVVPNWDFEVVENPAPGQYRWLQFAWKAGSPATTGLGLRVHHGHFGGVMFVAGKMAPFEGSRLMGLKDTPSEQWRVERIDLWKTVGESFRVRGLYVGAAGGPAGFDRIILGRSKSDLQRSGDRGR